MISFFAGVFVGIVACIFKPELPTKVRDAIRNALIK
jgi:hypothetical protein